ncbi:MAG: hypothetical protein AAGD04_18015, partial [Pseudomonadota bacterium]
MIPGSGGQLERLDHRRVKHTLEAVLFYGKTRTVSWLVRCAQRHLNQFGITIWTSLNCGTGRAPQQCNEREGQTSTTTMAKDRGRQSGRIGRGLVQYMLEQSTLRVGFCLFLRHLGRRARDLEVAPPQKHPKAVLSRCSSLTAFSAAMVLALAVGSHAQADRVRADQTLKNVPLGTSDIF